MAEKLKTAYLTV